MGNDAGVTYKEPANMNILDVLAAWIFEMQDLGFKYFPWAARPYRWELPYAGLPPIAGFITY
jgi:hypothetical protein